MYDVKDFLERALRQQRNMLKIYEKEMQSLPKGSLSVSYSGNRIYYRKHYQGERLYLGNAEQKEVQALQTRKIMITMMERIKENELLIRDFLMKYQDPSPESVKQTLGRAYQNENLELFNHTRQKSNKAWGYQPYKRNAAYPEQLTQKTLKGDFVRSKSEVIIANTYFSKKIQYRSEPMLLVGDKWLSPDFGVLVSRLNKVKYHEHFGMMHDEQYRKNALRKIAYYIENGYRPYEDILFTFDDLDGNIDAQVLDLLIESFMV